jgi:hypothetical protein
MPAISTTTALSTSPTRSRVSRISSTRPFRRFHHLIPAAEPTRRATASTVQPSRPAPDGCTTHLSDSSKFVKKLDSGQVGFVWSGNVRGCIQKLTLRGKIDLDWAAKSIPALKKRLAEHRAK